ncbi:hypothetical protein KAR91_33775 [Candidatus Pacearchaeota archaeon]|nr:hypothetical protein [Candidatus Pacearchaeota archaeon]
MNDVCQCKYCTVFKTKKCGRNNGLNNAEATESQRPISSTELPGYVIDFDIKHPNTMIVVNNKAELLYLIGWCEMKEIMPPLLCDAGIYQIAGSPNGGGWTQHMDRALYYVRFIDFVNATP